MVNFIGIRAIVVDTAGTTTDLDFIHNVLFPYSSTVLAEFLQQNQHQVLVESCLQDVRDIALEPEADLARLTEILQQWIAEDRKATPLKTIQGLIWKNGYKLEQFTGHVYQDFIDNVARLTQQGTRLYSFSSGSVASQTLLFTHSDGGDLSVHFNGHFDTRTGSKLDRQAYLNILNTISLAPKQVLFISDVIAELEAANLAGMQVCLMQRQGVRAVRFPHIASFAELNIN